MTNNAALSVLDGDIGADDLITRPLADESDVCPAAFARARWGMGAVYTILSGGKPAIDPENPDQKWLLDQLNRMYADHMIIETPWSHVRMPSDTDDVSFFKGNTTHQPITLAQLLQHAGTRGALKRHGVGSVCFLGGDLAGRRDAGRPLKVLADKGALVLDKTDLWGLYQALSFIVCRASATGPEADAPHLFVLNADGFYDPLLSIIAPDGDLQALGIIAVATPFDAAQAGLIVHGYAPQDPDTPPRSPLQPHDLVLFYSSGLHKFREYGQCFNAQRTPLNLQSFTALFPGVRSADEESCTYAGNIAEKIEFLRTRVALSLLLHRYKTQDDFLTDCPAAERDGPWADLFCHDFDRQMAAVRLIYNTPALKAHFLTLERLEEFGHDNNLNIYGTSIMLEDAGLEVDPDLPLPPPLREKVAQANPHKPWPGAELAHFSTSLTWDQMAQAFLQSYASGGRDPVITDRATLGVVPLVKLVLGNDIMDSAVLINATMRQKVDVRANRPILHSEDFLVPLDHNPDGVLAAEIPHYAQEIGPRAAAVRALMMVCHLSPNEQRIRYAFDRVRRVESIATQYTLMDDCNGHGDGSAQKCITGSDRRFLSGRHARHSFAEAARASGNPLSAISNLIKDADAFLVMPQTKRHDDLSRLIGLAFEQAVRVAKQIDDPAVKGKPAFALVRAVGDPDPVLAARQRVLDPLEQAGLRGMKPAQFIPVVNEPRDIRYRLDDAFRIKPIDAGSAPRHKVERGSRPVMPDEFYAVTLYGSASWQGREDIHRERELTFTLAALGFAMKSGGGNVAIMGAFNDGYESYRALAHTLWGDQLPHDVYNASIQCHQTAIKEGLFISPDRTVIYEDIREREWDLMQTDASLMRIGGDGTVEECANDWLMRKLGFVEKTAPFIVDARPMDHGARLFQGLDTYLSPEFYQDHGITFENDDVRAILRLVQDRAQRGKGIDLSHLKDVLPHVPSGHLLHRVWQACSADPDLKTAAARRAGTIDPVA